MMNQRHKTIIFIIFALMEFNFSFAMYDTHAGRFMQQDPIGYVDGQNLYEYVKSNSLAGLDPYGLWGTDVHMRATSMWAQKVDYRQKAAQAIGAADEAVDGWNGTGPKGPLRDQSYHFNRNRFGGIDTRMIHYSQHFVRAKKACLPGIDDPDKAAEELGTALHPYQDMEAHGDFGLKESYIQTIHNSKSPQTDLLGSYGEPGHYPDDPDLDTAGPIQYSTEIIPISKDLPPAKVTYDYYIYVPGKNRYNATRAKTVETLKEYYWFVETRGGCKCKKYFLRDE
jgi:hypothetical protein